MMNSSSNPQSFSKSLVYSFFWISSITLSLGLGFFLANIFSIREVKFQAPISKEYISTLKKQNLLFLSEKATADEIEKKFPTTAQVEVRKNYPNRLEINFKISHPSLQIKNNDYYLLISQNGKVLEQKSILTPHLRQISYYQKIRGFEGRPGEYLLDNDLLYALKLNKALKRRDFEIESLYIDKPGQVRLVGKDQQIYLNTKKRIDKNLDIVQNINKTFMIEGNPPKIINLLFEKAIILP